MTSTRGVIAHGLAFVSLCLAVAAVVVEIAYVTGRMPA